MINKSGIAETRYSKNDADSEEPIANARRVGNSVPKIKTETIRLRKAVGFRNLVSIDL
jgi:hypothetical protein